MAHQQGGLGAAMAVPAFVRELCGSSCLVLPCTFQVWGGGGELRCKCGPACFVMKVMRQV